MAILCNQDDSFIKLKQKIVLTPTGDSGLCTEVLFPDNPAYTGSSLDRDQSSPRDGTQYQFGHYGHRDQSPDGWVQETNLQQGGPHELHHRQSGSTHLNDTEAYNEDAMENLLKHLPSRQLGLLNFLCSVVASA